MSRILFTIIGRAPRGADYDLTDYDFGGGQKHIRARFFGAALFRHHLALGRAIDKLVILGTDGSMWDALVLELAPETVDNLWSDATDRRESLTADDALVDRIASALRVSLSVDVSCRIISKLESTDEQLRLVETLEREVNAGDRVVLDVTHGLRHQSVMLAQQGLMLEQTRGARVESVWYAARELGSKTSSPVISLTGLLEAERVRLAVAALERGGNPSALALVVAEEDDASPALQRLAFAWGTHNFARAREAALEARSCLKDSAIYRPLRAALDDLVASFGGSSLGEIELRQAERGLRTRDYMRAATHLHEAIYAFECDKRRIPVRDFTAREAIAFDDTLDDAWRLRMIRNAIVHGTEPSVDDVKKVLLNEQRLREELQSFLDRVRRRYR